MQITINTADLSSLDCGGGLRHLSAEITVDKTLPMRRQREIVTFEVLSALLDNDFEERREFLEDVAEKIVDAQDSL